ncbi:hypothetical protein RvY_07798 [Ramazzottius varieornatus]|uniref:BTB domain-containing protein n=1 Tax=Ramazzottius varieornatus TaxID=947166 RepID=A0A1D1VCV6_RAMVA|nr:hypothetical protein RvY_07798 [Ramazzottius varieornatus]
MDLCPSTSGADVEFGSCLSTHSHGGLQPEESMDVCSSDAVPEIQNTLHNGFCSPDCSVCRDITQMIGISSCQETKPIPVPPVVLVGRAPDASVINQWPPFGCRGVRCTKGTQPCPGPICFRRRRPEGDESEPARKIHCKNVQYPSDAFLAMNEFRKAEGQTLCDVKLQAAGHLFPAHRIVLAASSPYFRAMFTMGMKEANEEVIRLEKMCPRILGKLIDFCYTSEITIGEHNICHILPAAVMLQMQHVIDCCCHFLESQLDPCNAIGIAEFANQHGCTKLTSIAREYIDKNFTEVSHSEEFLQQRVCQLINLVKRDEIVVNTESEVYNAVMRWIRYDEKNRRPHLEDIVYVVRCYFLPPTFLEQQIKFCELLKKHPHCRDYLVKVMKELTSHKKCQMRKRCNPDLPTVIYVVGGYLRFSLSKLECFDPRTKIWRSLADMPTCRSGVCSAFVHGLLYVAGGRCTQPEGNFDSSAVDAYDPFGDSWRKCPDMSVARNRAGAVAIDNLFYVVGGSMQATFHRSGERYIPTDEIWSPIADMHRARLGLGITSLNRLLYAVGGFDGAERLRCVECYDPDTDQWKFVAPMNSRRSGAGVVSLDGFVYAIGGYDGVSQLSSVERYDVESDSWTTMASMSVARSALSVVAVDGRIYAIGGYDGQEFSALVECYDVDQNSWVLERSLPEGRSGHGAAVWWGSCCYAQT